MDRTLRSSYGVRMAIRLVDLLGCELPIQLAPMGSVSATPTLARAVARGRRARRCTRRWRCPTAGARREVFAGLGPRARACGVNFIVPLMQREASSSSPSGACRMSTSSSPTRTPSSSPSCQGERRGVRLAGGDGRRGARRGSGGLRSRRRQGVGVGRAQARRRTRRSPRCSTRCSTRVTVPVIAAGGIATRARRRRRARRRARTACAWARASSPPRSPTRTRRGSEALLARRRGPMRS